MLNPSACPGPGDAITWGARTVHPLDPRTDTDDTSLEDVLNALAQDRTAVLAAIESVLEQPDIAGVLADYFVAGRDDVIGAVLLARIEPRIADMAIRAMQKHNARAADDAAADRHYERRL